MKYKISKYFPFLLFLFVGSKQILFAQKPAQADIDSYASAEKEFIIFNPNYKTLKALRVKQLLQLLDKVRRLEADSYKTSCSHQILWELKGLVTQTADFKQIDTRIEELDSLLQHPEVELQDSASESTGKCFDAWFCKLNSFCDVIENGENSSSAEKSDYRLLDRVNSPKKLTKYLTDVSISDIARNGTDNLLEFNLSLTNLMRLILRNEPAGYKWNKQLSKTIKNLVFKKFRNPETGWWGERYVRDGKVQFVNDLSTTFHIVTYLHGNVPDLDHILTTTLAVKDLNYPVGWLWKGQYWNHNNMDVVALFKASWSKASEEQKKTISAEIEKMLYWCLNESLQADGSFKFNIADGSIEEAVYYGTSFLKRIGFFNKNERFWTNQDFENSEAVRQRIINYILKHHSTGGSGGSYYDSALKDCLNYKD